MYGLFPYYSADSFVEAHFEENLAPDSTISLLTRLRDGRTLIRYFSRAEVAAVQQSIESREQELIRTPSGSVNATNTGSAGPSEVVGKSYSVELRSGTSFIGVLVASRPTELEFTTAELGKVVVQRNNIRQIVELSATQVQRGYESVGNGTRLFFAPTARNLRRGEGYVQNIDIFLLGANYGVTDHFSVGLLVPIIPGFGAGLLAITPKVSIPVSEKFHLGAGVLYARAFGLFSSGGGGAGVGYGVATVGSADNNATLGLGYGFADADEGAPVVMLGGTTRISRRFSLLNETYIFGEDFVGLIGARVAASRVSGSLGFLYGVNGGRIYPAYAEVAYRFGRVK
ncbi:hypothetical protein MUN84_10125 [Hymenobacter sp. 5516J-16]|uniref:hypothetical protein n=1 Tax=Hymenobacter sp. 5516J-16 TaxID=2932253 RepID=UPI001FD53CDD|nr:hypothetical protein [Hymenobacter sp. 5516J-16]UOQ78847.1 hypothetical protein MUN84_10125 [Hymenobacter sp. 5516J-16]